jgi:hypothetical protein
MEGIAEPPTLSNLNRYPNVGEHAGDIAEKDRDPGGKAGFHPCHPVQEGHDIDGALTVRIRMWRRCAGSLGFTRPSG